MNNSDPITLADPDNKIRAFVSHPSLFYKSEFTTISLQGKSIPLILNIKPNLMLSHFVLDKFFAHKQHFAFSGCMKTGNKICAIYLIYLAVF